MSDTLFLEIQAYADGRKVAFFGAPSRPSFLPSSDFVGLINQDPRPATGEYAVDLSRFAIRGASAHSTATWLAVYRGRPDPVLGDRGTYVGAGVWLLDNPLIAVDQVLESLRQIVDRTVQIMDTDPPRAADNLNAQLPDFAGAAVQWLREHTVGGPTDRDLGLPPNDGAPMDAQRVTLRMRNVFGPSALTNLSAAMIARVRGGYTRLLLLQDPQATPGDAQRGTEQLLGVGSALNALNHHAVNYTNASAGRERESREHARQARSALEQSQAEQQQMRTELELLRQTAERQRVDLQRADSALRNERTAHEQTREHANRAAQLQMQLERSQAEFLAYKAKQRELGQSPELKDRMREGLANAVRPRSGERSRPTRSGNAGGGARRRNAEADFYQRNKMAVWLVLGAVAALIIGSMLVTYLRGGNGPAAPRVTPMESLPAPVQVPEQGVIDATQGPSVVDPAATPPATTP